MYMRYKSKLLQSLYPLYLYHIHCISQFFFIVENLFKKKEKKTSILKNLGI